MQKNLFGTDGIRAQLGTAPLSYASLQQLGNAIGKWMVKTYGKNSRVLLAQDTRISCDIVKSSLLSGMLWHPIRVSDAAVLPTPGAFVVMKEKKEFETALIISASHNPHHFNGIKIVDALSGKISEKAELEISSYYFASDEISSDELGTINPYLEATALYCASMIKKFPENFLANKKIVLDCAHGATSFIASALFKKLGADPIVINNSPDGKNINHNCGSTHPEQIQKTVLQEKAYAGFAFDGDGDRIYAVNSRGEIKDGDDILALLHQHPAYCTNQLVVGTIMSNEGLAQELHSHKKSFKRTAVGDKHIARELIKKRLSLGGEPSGHIIMADHCLSSDGLFCALRILEIMQQNQNHLMESFTRFPSSLKSIIITHKKNLDEGICAQLINDAKANLQSGRLIVRYSGTEPLVRILAEAQDGNHASLVVDELAKNLIYELR